MQSDYDNSNISMAICHAILLSLLTYQTATSSTRAQYLFEELLDIIEGYGLTRPHNVGMNEC